MMIIILVTCVSLYSVSPLGTNGQFGNLFPGGRQKVKLTNILAA